MAHVAGILNYRNRTKTRHEYLLRWLHGSPADDTWVSLTDISNSLDPFLFQFHQRYPKFPMPPALAFGRNRTTAGRMASSH